MTGARRGTGFYYLIDSPRGKGGRPYRIHGRDFGEIEHWVRRHFRNDPGPAYLDVTRLDIHGKPTSFSRRYFRDMTHRTF